MVNPMVSIIRCSHMTGYIILAVAVASAAAVFAGISAAEDSSCAGTSDRCGDDLTWEYIKNTHTLTISGSGAMYDPKVFT